MTTKTKTELPPGMEIAPPGVSTQRTIMWCETHDSGACKPARCVDVRLYRWIPARGSSSAHGADVMATCQNRWCGQEFPSIRATAKFCSAKCRKAVARAGGTGR